MIFLTIMALSRSKSTSDINDIALSPKKQENGALPKNPPEESHEVGTETSKQIPWTKVVKKKSTAKLKRPEPIRGTSKSINNVQLQAAQKLQWFFYYRTVKKNRSTGCY